MKIVCPECSSGFDVPVSLVGGAGRRVRCGACGHIWMYETPVESSFGSFRALEGEGVDPIPASLHPHPSDDDRDEDEDGPTAAEKLSAFMASVQWKLVGRAAAGFALGGLVVVALAFALGKVNVAGPFTSMAVAVGALHPDDVEGLEIADVTAKAGVQGGDVVTTVTGRIVNDADGERLVPLLRIMAVDAGGKRGEMVRIKTEQDLLRPGESLTFTAELRGEVVEGARVRVNFYSE